MQYSLKIGIDKDLMLMLALNVVIDQFSMANSVCGYGHVLKKGVAIFCWGKEKKGGLRRACKRKVEDKQVGMSRSTIKVDC